MSKYSGIDLHSNNCVVAVIDDDDRVCCQKRVPNELTKIVALLEPHRDCLVGVVVESTFNWYWLVDGLIEHGFAVKLANTAAIAQYNGLKYSGDEHDARHLAHLLKLKLLRFGHVFPPEWRAMRDLARKRLQLVQSRTEHILAFETLYARQTGGRIGGNAVKRLTMDQVAEWNWLDETTIAAQANLTIVQALEVVIDSLEQQIRERVKMNPHYEILRSVPGIGEILSSVIMLETGPIERFASAGNYASYARCVGSARNSNGKKKGEGNRKNGNAYLAWAFVEAAHFAMRFSEPAKRFYDRKKARTNTAVATKALAHKLARACYHMLKEQTVFDEKRCFS
jgi:transposase